MSEPQEPIGVGQLGETGEQLALFDEPAREPKRYIPIDGWPESEPC
ncbi:MAG: hypothetical protein ACLP9Y_27885 [Mycobacterium sp.]